MKLNTITVADWLDYIKTVPDESVDLVLTDPPYESLRRWEGVGTTAIAAMRTGRQWAGCELLQKHADRANLRIAAEKRATSGEQLGLWTPETGEPNQAQAR